MRGAALDVGFGSEKTSNRFDELIHRFDHSSTRLYKRRLGQLCCHDSYFFLLKFRKLTQPYHVQRSAAVGLCHVDRLRLILHQSFDDLVAKMIRKQNMQQQSQSQQGSRASKKPS